MPAPRLSPTVAILLLLLGTHTALAEAPAFTDYCQRLQQEIQGKKHGFLAGNVTYYVGGFHASWELKEHETLGLTHPFHHDLRGRGVGLVQSRGKGHDDTGLGNDFSGWEFYKDTRVLYGSVLIGEKTHRYPVPTEMYWRPDRMICEYEVAGVRLREEKFIAANDVACSMIVASQPVTLRFDGQSFLGRHSQTSTATIKYDSDHNAIQIVEGGTTKCRPETDRSERIAPIMYQGMSTVLSASRDFARSHRFQQGERGEWRYEFDVPCDSTGVVLVWSMHDDGAQAIQNAMAVLGRKAGRSGTRQEFRQTLEAETEAGAETLDEFRYKAAREVMLAKTRQMNRQINEEVPWFRCSERKFEDIYYYLWSLYLMYYIDVQHGWEMEPHTQTAVNNFLGMHRYDATFQSRVGAWTANKSHYAYGNVLTWKHLFQAGHYRKSPDGVISLADNKGTTWHSGVYGNELSEHVLAAWQIYQHTGDVEFLRECYEGYFREVFRERIAPFFSNHFEVAEALANMARLTGHDDDVAHWLQLVPHDRQRIRTWFDQRWQANGHEDFFAGSKDGMLMTTGFWHMRSKHFPRDYAVKMTRSWALDRNKGFYGDFFPRAMSGQSMQLFATKVDHSFGYTPDTAYFTLDGMFRQRLGDSAWRLTLNHLENYNFHSGWNMPIAPEAFTRSGKLFGDQYSNFNAGKLLLYLEGLAGLDYSIPDNRLAVRDTMPANWDWMEVRLPIQMPGEKKTHWPVIRYERSQREGEIHKSIHVRDCPLRITIEPWPEEKRVIGSESQPHSTRTTATSPYPSYVFDSGASAARVRLRLAAGDENDLPLNDQKDSIASPQPARWVQSYDAGYVDANGAYAGGSEIMHLAAHNGKLFAANGYWMDGRWAIPPDGQKQSAQVLRLDSSDGQWQVDLDMGRTNEFGLEYMKGNILKSVTFTRDEHGKPLPEPRSLLVMAAGARFDRGGAVSAWVRNDDDGSWHHTLVRHGSAVGGVRWVPRDMQVYQDKVTGIERLFLLLGNPGVITGVYDPKQPSKILWARNTEFPFLTRGAFRTRPLGMIQANGSLYFSVDDAIYRRIDGARPTWEEVINLGDDIDTDVLSLLWGTEGRLFTSRFLPWPPPVSSPVRSTAHAILRPATCGACSMRIWTPSNRSTTSVIRRSTVTGGRLWSSRWRPS